MRKKEGVRGEKRSSVCVPALMKIKGAVIKRGRSKNDLKKKGQRRGKERRGRSLVFQAPTGQVGFNKRIQAVKRRDADALLV